MTGTRKLLLRIRRIGEQAVETPAQMRRQRHPQIHPFTTYRQGEPSGQPLQTLDITTVHLKYMDVCRADAWTGIKFFQQKPDGKADKIIIAHAYDLSACQCAVCQAEQSPAECCLYGTLGLVQCYIRYGAFVECRTVFLLSASAYASLACSLSASRRYRQRSIPLNPRACSTYSFPL